MRVLWSMFGGFVEAVGDEGQGVKGEWEARRLKGAPMAPSIAGALASQKHISQ